MVCLSSGSNNAYVVTVWVEHDSFGNAAEYVTAGGVEASAADHDQVSSDLVGDRCDLGCRFALREVLVNLDSSRSPDDHRL